jgi:hypothetical protein
MSCISRENTNNIANIAYTNVVAMPKETSVPKSVFLSNIIKVAFRFDDVPPDVSNEIAYHENVSISLRKDANMMVYVYLPAKHPVIENRLLKVGRIIEWQEHDTPYRSTIKIDAIENIDSATFLKDMPHSVIHKIKYISEPYVKIKGIYLSSEPIIRVQGYATTRKEYTMG